MSSSSPGRLLWRSGENHLLTLRRHGARLDAADKSWHLTSPTPYDPPLTYGGWNQCKALGTRIASALQHRADSRPATPGCEERRDWRRRYTVVIHSSPFLRCIQSSIAIGAGIAQHRDHSTERRELRKSNSHRRRRRSKPSIDEEDEEAYDYFHEGEGVHSRAAVKQALREPGVPRATLRIDAFLGEWLTPDYYDDITPPPGSTMMVAGAKADLLRHEQIDVFQPSTAAKGNFPGGWIRPGSSDDQGRDYPPSPLVDDHTPSMTPTGQAHPRIHRASSHSSIGSNGSLNGHKPYSSLSTSRTTYVPPVPAYSISPAEPIPRGYVAHARDACIDVDFQWDSMRPPQDWGDGGEYGEEWSAMHKRFRHGLYQLIAWYKEHPVRYSLFDPDSAVSSPGSVSYEDDRELVVILVTHGAGCNALIGALTNQPVLMDVGLASLTMAVHREQLPSTYSKSAPPVSNGSDFSLPPRRRSSLYYGLSEEYEMKLMASSDHLRAGADGSRATALQSPNLVPRIPEYRRRAHANTGPSSLAPPTPNSFFRGPELLRGMNINGALGSIRRSPTISGTSFNRFGSASPSRSSSGSASGGSSGLWTKNLNTPSIPHLDVGAAAEYSVGQIEELSLGPSVNGNTPVQPPTQAREPSRDRARLASPLPDVRSRSMTQPGLWGSNATAPVNSHDMRAYTPKRRWSVNMENDG
jgi:broad specificity phosphatase PhoE